MASVKFSRSSIMLLILIIMGSFSLLIVNINNIIDDLENENEVVAFVDENLSDEAAQALQADIEALQNISGVRFVSREDARTSFEEDYDKSLFSDIDSSVFRHRYVINLADISLMGDTKAALESVDGIAKVNAHLEYAKGFITVRNIVSVVSLVLIILLTAVSLLIMTNTIKLATFTRREEIAIMKMVGASNGFIRCPFVVEGLVLGLLGGGLAFLLEWGIYVLVCNKIVTGVTGTLISVVAFSTVMWPLLIAFLAAGVLVGVIGGMTAIRNYLKV
ncbi:MAG TPA: ABC transporter permease [Clostridiales bacterium]|nr:ABC transporter permease [Clostridiales bacterium]